MTLSRAAILSALCLMTTGLAARADAPMRMPHNESGDRVVDGAALGAIEVAVQRLSNVARAKAGTAGEVALLLRLAETQQKAASIRFRVERGKVNTETYRRKYNESIATLNVILEKFPQSSLVPRAVFLRGVALGEVGRKDEALADYEAVVDRYPQSKDRLAAALYGYDIASDKGDFARGVKLLLKAGSGAKPGSPIYALVVERLSWSQYAMGNFDEALKYLSAWGASVDEKEKDRVRKNAALFLAAGLEAQPDKYTIDYAYRYFRSLRMTPSTLGDACVQYAYLIRAKNRNEDLEAWVVHPGMKDIPPAFRLDLLAVNLGNQLNRKLFAQLDRTIDAIHAILNSGFDPVKEGGERVVRLARDVSEAVAALSAAKDPYVGPLMKCYRLLIALSQHLEGDTAAQSADRLAKLYFNLAETAFRAKEFDVATDAYRHLLDEYKSHPLAAGAQVKSLAARFEYLRVAGVVRKDLDVMARKDARAGELDPKAKEWIGWLDRALAGGVPISAKEDMDIYRFEAVRTLYAAGRLDEALDRAQQIVIQTPTSAQAPGAWALYQDTLIVGQEWQVGYEGAKRTLKEAKAPLPKELGARVGVFAEQCAFKRLEGWYAAKQEKDVLANLDTYLAEFPGSVHREDAIRLGANAALAQQDKPRALHYFMLGNAATRSDPRVTLVEAAVAEETYDFSLAARKYVKYLAIPKTSAASREGLGERALKLAWLSGNRRLLLREVIPASGICAEGQPVARALKQDCLFYAQLARIPQPPAEPDKVPGKGVFEFLASRSWKQLTVTERLRELQAVITAWSKLPEERRLLLLPPLLQRLPSLALGLPNVIRAKSPISRKSFAGLPQRSQWITELERFGAAAANLPSIQFAAAYELALSEAYRDFGEDLRGILEIPGLEGDALQAHQNAVNAAISATDLKAKALLERVVARGRDGGLEGELPARLEMIAHAGIPAFAGLPDALPWVQALPLPDEGKAMGQAFAREVAAQNWDAFAWLLRDLKAKNWVYSQWVAAGEALWLAHTHRYPEGRAQLAQAQPNLPRDLAKYYAAYVPEVNRAPTSEAPATEQPRPEAQPPKEIKNGKR